MDANLFGFNGVEAGLSVLAVPVVEVGVMAVSCIAGFSKDKDDVRRVDEDEEGRDEGAGVNGAFPSEFGVCISTKDSGLEIELSDAGDEN